MHQEMADIALGFLSRSVTRGRYSNTHDSLNADLGNRSLPNHAGRGQSLNALPMQLRHERKTMNATDEVFQILRDAKVLARRYYHLTGKPLGVTGEIAEFEAARILDLELELARQAGYDATETRDGLTLKIQIKGRYFPNVKLRGGRLGSIDLKQPFDRDRRFWPVHL
jgi:hypothetical protein